MKKISFLLGVIFFSLSASFAKSAVPTKHNSKFALTHNIVTTAPKQVVQDCTYILTIRVTDTFSFTVTGKGDTCAAAQQNAITLAGQVVTAFQIAGSLI